MDLAEFIDTYRDAIAERVVESYAPRYRPSDCGKPLPHLLRTPLGAQADAIRGAALSLEEHRGTTVVGEMGTGKTFIAASAAHLAGFRRILVLCPPHLTRKWKREVEETVPDARAAVVASITDLEKLRLSNGPGPLFAVMSRERAKLSYRWLPAVVERWATADGRLVRNEETLEPFRVPCCPDCFEPIVDMDGLPLTQKDLARRKRTCDECGTALWKADPSGPKRYPLSDYVKHHLRGFFDLLVSDEVHEYKGRGSAQGIAAGILADACGKSLSLSGTLMGGYSSTLFHLLYRFSPEIRGEFGRGEESRWIERYGFVEHTIGRDDGESLEDGRTSRRRKYRKVIRERPGLAPAALFHLIGNSVFLRLSDVAAGLPPYEERVLLSDMETEEDGTGLSQRSAYDELFRTLRAALTDLLAKGSKRLLATYLQTLLAYPDGCTRGETVFDPETEDVLVQVPPLSEERLYPKERALVDLVAAERLAGRRVLVYATHTGTRDITGRMEEFLSRHGFKVAVMKADAVPPERREAWVAKCVEEGVDVLVCHPRLVQTGLDLVEFPTICWYETDYSVYTMRQASRRSWRIGQTEPVQVVFMAYRNTLQADALKLVAQKLQSSLAVEGELPEDGLAAYGDEGDDLMLALARKIVAGEEDAGSVESVFEQAQQVAADAEALLVDADWRAPKPVTDEPEVAEVGVGPDNGRAEAREPQRTLFSWAEFPGGRAGAAAATSWPSPPRSSDALALRVGARTRAGGGAGQRRWIGSGGRVAAQATPSLPVSLYADFRALRGSCGEGRAARPEPQGHPYLLGPVRRVRE